MLAGCVSGEVVAEDRDDKPLFYEILTASHFTENGVMGHYTRYFFNLTA